MKEITYEEIATPELSEGAILHTHLPFIKDYTVLHCLLKKYNPVSVMEIGTHVGEGTNIICNAVPNAKVYSLDLPSTEAYKTLQHPSLKNIQVGAFCQRPYTQLWGDSILFPYSPFQCEAWFIDGEHDYKHAVHESQEALKSKAKLIIWHDSDIPQVWGAIHFAFAFEKEYDLIRIEETRIAYAIRL